MPKPDDLNVGELAVNNNVGNEFISLKSSNGEVVRFSSDEQLVAWMNKKEAFPVSGNVSADISNNASQIIIKNNQRADSATTGADIVNNSNIVVDTSAFALSGGNVTFNSVTVNDISAVTINGKDANSLGDITNVSYTPNNEIEDGVSGNTLEFVQSGNSNTVSVNLEFDDELNETSVNAVQNKVLNEVLEEIEEVTSASLNDLNDRVLELENTPDLHVTGGRFSNGTLYIEQENGPTIEIGGISGGGGSDGNNYPSSLTLNSNNVLVLGRNGMSDLTADLSTLDNGKAPTSGRVEAGTGAQSGSTFINFYNGTTKLFSVNADDLMIDGMVESVSIGQAVPEGETEAVACLIVDWNTAAGDKTTNIPLTSIFNPDNYYTKQEVNNALGSDFYPSSVTSSVTAVINGLEDRVGDLENKQDIHVVSGSFSQASATLTLTMSSGSPITVSGMVTGGGGDPIVAYNNYVTGGSVNSGSGIITLVHNVDGGNSVPDALVTGLSEYLTEYYYDKSDLESDFLKNSGGVVNGQLTVNNSEQDALIVSGGNALFSEQVVIEDGLTVGGSGVSSRNGFTHTGIPSSETKNDYVVLAGGGYKALSSITPTDVWVNTSGDTMNGSLIFEDLHDVSDPQQLGLIYQGSNYLELHTNGNIVTTNGEVHSVHGFMHDGIESAATNSERNNYVLLGGGGYTALSSITPTDVWVNTSGDTMTGSLAISGNADGGSFPDELFGVTNTRTDNKIFSIMNDGGTDHVEVRNSSFNVNSTFSVAANGNVGITGNTEISGALEVSDGVVNKGNLRVSGETRVKNDVYSDGGVYSRNGFHYYSPNTSGSNDNSYVLLAGGGVKPLSDFTTGGGGTVEGEKYLDSATLNQSTGNIEFGVHEGTNVTLTGLSEYVSSKTSDLNNSLNKLSGETNSLRGELTAFSGTVEDDYATKDSVTDLSNSLVSLSAKTDTNATSIGNLRGELTAFSGTVEGDYVKVSGFSDAFKGELSGGSKTYLDNAISTSTSVSAIQADVNAVSSNTSVLSSAINVSGSSAGGETRNQYISIIESVGDEASLRISDAVFEAMPNGANGDYKLAVTYTGTFVDGPLNVNGETTMNSSLNVSGDTTINGKLTTNSGLTVPIGSYAKFGNSSNNGGVIISGNSISGIISVGYYKNLEKRKDVVISGGTSENTGLISVKGSVKSTSGFVYDNSSVSGSSSHVLTTNGSYMSLTDIANSIQQSSDRRLKENIESISNEDLENAKNIEFKSFNFISGDKSNKVGVIAQELQDNGLGKFTRHDDADYLTVDYISLLCLKIAQLEKKIKDLEEKLK